MIEKTGALDVYFEKQIEIVVAEPGEFSADAIEEVLDAAELEYSSVEREVSAE